MREKIWLASPHMGGEEQKYIKEAFDTNWIAPLGKNVNELEKSISEFAGLSDGAALSSGTAALHLALKAAGVSEGDIVFCSSLTFSASANPIIYLGAKPVFIDSDIHNWNMSPEALERAFEQYTPKAVLVVDLYGQSADYDAICDICKKHNTPIVEDSAEALGSSLHGKKCGSFGDFGVFSFNGNKIITTSGGGMVVSNNVNAITKIRFWATQSRENERFYHHKELGYNYRMSNICAGIGRGQLLVLNDRITKKRKIFADYKKMFNNYDNIKMMPSLGESNCWLSAAILHGINPYTLMEALEKEDIESRPIWKPMHMQPFFEKYPYITGDDNHDNSRYIFEHGICLPSDTKMNADDFDRVVSVIRRFF